MAVDEFGREVPAGRGGRREDGGSGSPSRYGPEDPSFLNEALPTSRYDGAGTAPPLHHHSHHHHGGSSSGGHHHHHHQQQQQRHYSSNHNSSHHHHNDNQRRKRKHRDDSPGPSSRGGRKSSSPHPSTLYAEEPMMCQFLWKESKGQDNNNINDDDDSKPDEDATASDDNTSDSAAYDEYRKGYCLNYIRMFFNQHLDDSWFRSMYSPLAEQRLAIQERQRATKEAQAFLSELETSIAKNQATETSTSSNKSPCFFILKARLGGGIKQTSSSSSTNNPHYQSNISPSRSMQHHSSLSNPVPGTHVMSLAHQVLPILEVPPHVTDDQLIQALLSHAPSTNKAGGMKASDLQLYSSSVPGHGNLFRTIYVQCSTEEIRKEIIQQLNHVDRAAAAAVSTGSTEAAAHHVPRKEDTFVPKTLPLEVECSDAYGRTEVDADGKGGAGGTEGGVPPRKVTVWVSTQTSKLLSPHVAVLSAAVSSKVHIPKDMKAARTIAEAYDIRRNIPKAARLEAILAKAELSSNAADADADPQDIEDALDVAIAYLRRVHLFSFYNGCARANRVGDVLNGTHATSTIHLRLGIADEILNQAAQDDTVTVPAAAAAAVEGAPEEPPKVDLLVQRHELSIDKALKEVQPWLDDPDQWSQVILSSPEKDAAAKKIQENEQKVEPAWIEDHAVIDEDGRARCSFHFCRKLFKDSTFLKKHLIKKHSEFLKAERAKCHDQSMMEAWDAQEQRPVPSVLVDCGRVFSLVPSPVIGAAVPLAEDPEPELWRRQEERKREEDQIRKEREERFTPAPDLDGPLFEERNHHSNTYNSNTAPNSAPRAPRPSNFVDVDDMKEEKVELAFDNVEIPIIQPPKKKRKKKLL